MSGIFQILIALAAIAFVWWFIRHFFFAPSEPTAPVDPYSEVPAPRRRNPKDRAGAVAVEEPDEEEDQDLMH